MNETFSERQRAAYDLFDRSLEGLVKDPLYLHKFVIVLPDGIRGVFDTFGAALEEAVGKYPENGYIIQQVIPDGEIINFLYPAIA